MKTELNLICSHGFFSGAMKPPHCGHFNIVKNALMECDIVSLIISKQPREGITSDQSLKIWEEYIKLLDTCNINLIVADVTPIRTTYETIEKINDSQIADQIDIFLYCDKEDMDRYDHMDKFSQIHTLTKRETIRSHRSSDFREAIRNKDQEKVKQFVPGGVDLDRIFTILNI